MQTHSLAITTAKNSQTGFTLIELIIVIVILGILAVSAAPRFIDISSDAKIASLESMGGAIMSASKLVYAKAAVQGLTSIDSTTIDLDNDGVADIETAYGYPSGSRTNGISQVMDSNFEIDWIWSTQYGDAIFYLTLASLTHTSGAYVNRNLIMATNCYIAYTEAAANNAAPTLELVTTGC